LQQSLQIKEGLATVYRAIQALAKSGEIDVIRSIDGESLYRRCGQRSGHHHHLICRKCGLTIEIAGDAIEEWSRKTGVDKGFIDLHHLVDIYGICKKCA